jgi:hypothetical protein
MAIAEKYPVIMLVMSSLKGELIYAKNFETFDFYGFFYGIVHSLRS